MDTFFLANISTLLFTSKWNTMNSNPGSIYVLSFKHGGIAWNLIALRTAGGKVPLKTEIKLLNNFTFNLF